MNRQFDCALYIRSNTKFTNQELESRRYPNSDVIFSNTGSVNVNNFLLQLGIIITRVFILLFDDNNC